MQQVETSNLPIKLGGLGLRCSSDQHLAAFTSSMESVSSTVEAFIGMKTNLDNEVNANCHVRLQDVDRRIQKKIHVLLTQATNVRGARLQSLLDPKAGAWLTTPPKSALGLHLEAEEFQGCVKYRLGIPS